MIKLDFICNFPFFCIMILMAGAIASPVLGAKASKLLCMYANLAGLGLSAALLWYTASTGESFVYVMGHFPAPWGNELRGGALEALVATAFFAAALLSLWGSQSTTEHDVAESKQNLFYIMVNMLMASLMVLIYTNDIFTAYVFIEINTITACAIVMSKQNGRTVVATIRYLIMSLVGSGLFLFAVTLLYNITGHLLMQDLQESVKAIVADGRYAMPLTVIVGLMTVSMAIKSALYPFHSWLPDAHGNATTASSAILSGLVVKGFIILLVKIFHRVFTPEIIDGLHIAPVLLTLGLLGMVMGSLSALREKDIKRMIAYSSVAQIGYIFMGIGINTAVGVAAAFFHILAHMVTKPMLFTAAGGLIRAAGGSRRFEELRGSAYRDPLGGAAFAVGAGSMVGLPLMAGFISKMYFATASIQSGSASYVAAVLAVLALSTVLNALYYVPALMCVYGRDRDMDMPENPRPRVRPPGYAAALAVFMAANFALGIFSDPVLDIIRLGLSVFG